jgi:diguanylate cyclase (GGDEF)-like protein
MSAGNPTLGARVVEADAKDRRRQGLGRLVAFGLGGLALTLAYPWFSPPRQVGLVAVVVLSTIVAVAYGRHAAPRGRRLPWTLVLTGLLIEALANTVLFVNDPRVVAADRVLDIVGNLFILAAALTFIIRRGARDRGGTIDAAVIALAAGSLAWVVLPHRLGTDTSFVAQVALFTAIATLSGVLGALVRMARTTGEPGGAGLWWLVGGIVAAITSDTVSTLGGANLALQDAAVTLFMAAFIVSGMWGLDPNSLRMANPPAVTVRDRLSAARLVFLGLALAIIPTALGARAIIAGDATGLLLIVQAAFIATLVMVRIGFLSAERDQAEKALDYQATHDPLTHLPNRRMLVTRLGQELDHGGRSVLLFCDLDGFKLINDKFGHEAGDELLVEVARRLRGCVPEPHEVSRLGGDEFVVLLSSPTSEQVQSFQACIVNAVTTPIDEARGIEVGISIGTAEANENRTHTSSSRPPTGQCTKPRFPIGINRPSASCSARDRRRRGPPSRSHAFGTTRSGARQVGVIAVAHPSRRRP